MFATEDKEFHREIQLWFLGVFKLCVLCGIFFAFNNLSKNLFTVGEPKGIQ